MRQTYEAERQVRVGILGASFDTGNLGVGALAFGSVKCVLAQHPDAGVFLLDYAKRPSLRVVKIDGKEIVVPTVNLRFSWKAYLTNNIASLIATAALLRLIPIRRLREWMITKNNCLSQIYNADFLAAISGGDSFSDIYGFERLLYVSLPQILVLVMGKKLLLLPQTIGPFKTGLGRLIARAILQGADRIYSRDWLGLRQVEAMLGHGRSSKASFCYDVGFILDPVPPQKQEFCRLLAPNERKTPLVGLNVSGLLYMGGYNRRNMFGLQMNYQELIDELIEFLVAKRQTSVLLVPHVMGGGLDTEGDIHACRSVYEKLRDRYGDRLGWIQDNYDQSEIKHVIGQCDFFIGSRMHACIAAVSQHVPAVCIAYSDKFIGVMEAIGIEDMVADARRLSTNEILGIVAESYDRRAALRQQLAMKMPQVRKTVLNLLSGMANGRDQETAVSYQHSAAKNLASSC